MTFLYLFIKSFISESFEIIYNIEKLTIMRFHKHQRGSQYSFTSIFDFNFELLLFINFFFLILVYYCSLFCSSLFIFQIIIILLVKFKTSLFLKILVKIFVYQQENAYKHNAKSKNLRRRRYNKVKNNC